jgi:tetratricopeptide (TPR) repeat protein
MMSTMKVLLLFFAMIFWFEATAQSEKEKKAAAKQQEEINKAVQKQMEKLYGKSIEPTKEYEEAETLVQKAITALNTGEVNLADSLIRLSIKTYPVKSVFQFVKLVCAMPDVSKANSIMDELYQAVLQFPQSKILMLEPFAQTYVDGKMVIGIKFYEKNRAAFNFSYEAYKINKGFASLKQTINSIKRLLSLPIQLDTKAPYDFEFNQQENSKFELAILQKDFNFAESWVEAKPITPTYTIEAKNNWLAYIQLEKGNYVRALELAKTLTGNFLSAGLKTRFSANALAGNNDEALADYKQYMATQYVMNSNDLFYYLAIIDVNKGNYREALANLDSALHHKLDGYMEGMEVLFLDKWKVYKVYGDAYSGLKQFDKARDNYNISLLLNPDYEPAIAALTKLESSIATTSSTDKTPPKIAVTEPSVKRGLQVTTSGNDVMVRGIAEDPSGLKSVSINGQSVYAQASGNFWGNIVLKDGLNKIIIKATDGAGNVAEQTFEITKNNTPETEIVAVTAKEGKNYCLLIAAQNYSDASIPSLENPIQDAVRLKLVLKKNYNFTDENIITLFNPNANDIKRQLLELTNVIQPEDNLLIFYAGHGIWVEKEKKGYWLMTDAKRNDPNTWVSNKDVLSLIAKLPSRHTLLITDACFSGGVFKTRSITKDAPSAIQMMDAKVSRVAITSGNDTEVPDQSVFMKYLVKALTENKDQFMPAQKMFITHIMEAVMTEGKTEPRYGTLELAGHVGGDFIFVKK